MASSSTIGSMLSDAKKVLGQANDFTKKVEGSPVSRFGPQQPTHEFAKAPYAMAKKSASVADGGSDVAAGIKARADIEKQYNDSVK